VEAVAKVIALDTSILARYILNDNPSEAGAAGQLISSNDCSISWSVLIELCWILESSARLPRSEVAGSLAALANSDFIAVPDDALLTWAIDRYAHGADFPDMIHLASAMSGASEFACFDRKLARQAGADTPLPIRTLQG
jgi:predicted nucleic-acid-binding protein